MKQRDRWFVAYGHRYYLREIIRRKGQIWYVSRIGREINRADVTRWSPWLALSEHSL